MKLLLIVSILFSLIIRDDGKLNKHYIRLSFSYDYEIMPDMTSNSISYLRNYTDTSGPMAFYLLMSFHKEIFRTPQSNLNIDYESYIVGDTLTLLINGYVQFIYIDSLMNKLPNNTLPIFKGEKKVKVKFLNDSADIKVHWKFDELKLVPLKHGDY